MNRYLSLLNMGAVACLCGAALGAKSSSTTDFEKDLAPLFIRRCLECHNARNPTGGLNLSSREGHLKGGESGPAAIAGQPAESLLVQRIERGEMPPEVSGRSRRLPPEEALRIRTWIAEGMPWPDGRVLDPYEITTETRAGRDWWSLRPIVRPPVPVRDGEDAGDQPVDAFLLAGVRKAGIEPAPIADRRTLIRRLSSDITGLRPTLEAVDDYVHDTSETAYPRLVDRLLASPHFGERWGRYWLDVVRYAETCGYERDQTKPGVWKYRDWVIDSINGDKPFDRFVMEQIAGDELPDACEGTVIATGFLRLGTWNDEPNDPEEYKFERLEDMVDATSTALLAMSVKCARCHDHKFDPIPQSDYYRMAAVFWAGFIEPRDSKWLGGPNAAELQYDVFGWTDRSAAPPPLHLLKKGDPRRPGEIVPPAPLSLLPALERPMETPAEGARTSLRRKQLAEWIMHPQNPLTARVIINRLWQYHFGHGLVRSPNNFGFTGERPTHPELLDWLANDLKESQWHMKRMHRQLLLSRTYRLASVHPDEIALRRTDPENRLWWRAERRRLDAEGLRDAMLVASGLLNLRQGGASFTAEIAPEALEGLSRKSGDWSVSSAAERSRRSVYMFTRRSLLLPLMTTFDFADTTLPCGQRSVTTVATQALALLNNSFVHEQSQAMARRVFGCAGRDRSGQVEWAWRFALVRSPTGEERTAALRHLEQQQEHFRRLEDDREGGVAPKEGIPSAAARSQWEQRALESLCHVLLNCNEFLYVD